MVDPIPNFKVTITHAGSDTDYENEVFSSITVKRRENNYDVATLICGDENSVKYLTAIDVFDSIKIYFKDALEATYTQVFGGTIRQANPVIGPNGYFLSLLCKSHGAALEETHCNRDYGLESSHSDLNTVKEILEDLVDNFVNKSLGSTSNTGYSITKKIANIASGTSIKYVNNPFRTNRETIDLICALTSAIGAGSSPGAHWIVDNNKNLIFNTIGAHENVIEWPDWWNGTESASTLTQGIDFLTAAVLDKSEEFANKVILLTDFRRPAYDYLTEDSGGASLWGNDGLVGITNSTTQKIVGSHSLRMETSTPTGYAYYPSAANANWDVTRWGSEKTIPRLNFYIFKPDTLVELASFIYMSTNDTARKTDYFYCAFSTWTEPDNQWIHKSIPIGPYWASAEESKQYRWTASTANASWSNIDSVEFVLLADPNVYTYIDDLHFSGKIIRSAKNNANILANKEYQKVLISRNAMDDSCIAADDSGFAGRIAYAELLRRISLPVTITFQINGKPKMMPGQKARVKACKTAIGTFKIDSIMRMTTVQHDLTEQGFITTVTATIDLKNSNPIGLPDQYAMWQENMFVNSREAKNIRSGAEVDLLIPILEKNYPS